MDFEVCAGNYRILIFILQNERLGFECINILIVACSLCEQKILVFRNFLPFLTQNLFQIHAEVNILKTKINWNFESLFQ